MAKTCFTCGKRPSKGNVVKRRGMAKKKGGVGQKVTGITRRRFLPNLQHVRIMFDGTVKRVWVCAKCLKAKKVKKVA